MSLKEEMLPWLQGLLWQLLVHGSLCGRLLWPAPIQALAHVSTFISMFSTPITSTLFILCDLDLHMPCIAASMHRIRVSAMWVESKPSRP